MESDRINMKEKQGDTGLLTGYQKGNEIDMNKVKRIFLKSQRLKKFLNPFVPRNTVVPKE